MNHTAPARPAGQRASRLLLVGLAVVIAVATGSLALPSVSSSASSFREILRAGHSGGLGEADGVVPDGTSVLDDTTPAVAKLGPRLREALRRARAEASEDGVELYVTSGWRSRRYQEQLFRDAVAQYGSTRLAASWVARPGTSAHESGEAVDLGHSDATRWLSEHGDEYGLCQIYDNEPWHFELRPGAVDRGCPPTYADPTHDPRLQQ